MNKLKDTDLREARRRNYAETPQLPEGFMERMHEAVEQEESQPRRTRSYRLVAAITSIAAAILIAFLLWPESHEAPITQPVVTETIEQNTQHSKSSEPIIEEKKEAPQKPSEPSQKFHPANKPHKVPQEPLLAQAEPATEAPARNYSEETASNSSNPYLIVTAQLQDLRSRGERLDREVAMMMHN